MAARRSLRGTAAPVALIYHDILRAEETDPDVVGFAGPLARRYKLTRRTFEAHLEAIAAESLRVGRYDDPAGAAEVLLTFDDGGASAALAAEMLAARGWRGHFFVTSARIGTPGFLDEEGVRGLAAAGHVVGSHSHTHPSYMRELDMRELSEEWHTSREVLTEILGDAPAVAAIPGGSVSPAVLRAVQEAGYATVMTSEPRRRRRTVGGVDVIDRYTIWSSTTPGRVRGYVAQTLPGRSRLRAEWEIKKVLKRVSPSLYQRGRRIRARL
jgi:peptidoglycan/xylan/chitin deacetylase (PgdA/CDA1 family)